MTFPTIESCIGNTPLVRLQRLAGDSTNTILLKLEGNNPAGSVKDRIALAMVKDAESRGALKAGGTIIEPTSGTTGIGLAAVGASRGYKVILVMPDTMSQERRAMLAASAAQLWLALSNTAKRCHMTSARLLASSRRTHSRTWWMASTSATSASSIR